MKFNIAKSIDVEKLEKNIAKFFITETHSPYMFMNEDTMKELIANEVVEYPLGTIAIKDGCRIGTYQGNKVFMDNTKTFGEVELR